MKGYSQTRNLLNDARAMLKINAKMPIIHTRYMHPIVWI